MNINTSNIDGKAGDPILFWFAKSVDLNSVNNENPNFFPFILLIFDRN